MKKTLLKLINNRITPFIPIIGIIAIMVLIMVVDEWYNFKTGLENPVIFIGSYVFQCISLITFLYLAVW